MHFNQSFSKTEEKEGQMPDQLERRMIIKMPGKTPEHIKQLIKANQGYWDDLFNGWNLPITASQFIGFLDPKVSKKEHLLPQIERKGAFLMSKYVKLMETLKKQAESVILDAHRYEEEYTAKRQGNTTPIDFRAWSEFGEPPTPDGKTNLEYECEKLLYQRIIEIRRLTQEIEQIHKELGGK